MSRPEQDRAWWDQHPAVVDGWTRYPIPVGGNEWDALQEDFEDTGETFLVEYQRSVMGGYGPASVWVQR